MYLSTTLRFPEMMRPEPTQSERDRITMWAQQDRIDSLERRLVGAERRIEYLESMLGRDKRALVNEVERMRRCLRELQGG
jgi:hypothetical protein